ncbi:HNH endonuclease signature motif containing protein [Streptomyces sp. SCSIO ZS0520]|uniref:HNH endonuclease signature motif containing protein n=1 Tax=Streptomyces sp. SCSIO ZS0520 TaxID=2892996 RepID=UPI0021DAB822|nr:HNH endonuclease signature motif containing protein [Streptomyces sp. SCSIO ZS0520]
MLVLEEWSDDVTEGRTLIKRIGQFKDLDASQRTGRRRHRPLLLLWAIAQAVHGHPRQHSWTTIRDAVGPLLTEFAGAAEGPQATLRAFWELQKIKRENKLWEVAESADLLPASGGGTPKLPAMNKANPLAGLPEQDYDRLTTDFAFAAWAVSTLLVRFFDHEPAPLINALGLQALMAGEAVDGLRPLRGEPYRHRGEIGDAYGGNRVLGITPLADGILTVYSDDKGPYDDQRVPDSDWIAYTGDGLSGDQTLSAGNHSMANYQIQKKALRYWHKPHNGDWTFETWAVIVQRRRRWGRGEDGKQRREFVWILAPVPSPLRDSWPPSVREALEQDDGMLHDDSEDVVPLEARSAPTVTPSTALTSDSASPSSKAPKSKAPKSKGPKPKGPRLSDRELYQRLTAAAINTASSRSTPAKLAHVERYLRSPAARDAVLIRSKGSCENPSCLGHPTERTDKGAPLLEVDHVNDLARGGPDVPDAMVALCPNCHALKTRGENRRELTKKLRTEARARHAAFLKEDLD